MIPLWQENVHSVQSEQNLVKLLVTVRWIHFTFSKFFGVAPQLSTSRGIFLANWRWDLTKKQIQRGCLPLNYHFLPQNETCKVQRSNTKAKVPPEAMLSMDWVLVILYMFVSLSHCHHTAIILSSLHYGDLQLTFSDLHRSSELELKVTTIRVCSKSTKVDAGIRIEWLIYVTVISLYFRLKL